jgi:GT2 family glycosyltransferase
LNPRDVYGKTADRPQATPRGDLVVAALVLNWNQSELTGEAVKTVRDQVDHVYVVDNGSSTDDIASLRRLADSRTTIIENGLNLGYAGGCNRGLEEAVAAGFDAVFIMNNDAFPRPGCLEKLTSRLSASPSIAAVGPTVIRHGTDEVLHTACALEPRSGRGRWLQRGIPLSDLSDRPIRSDYLSGEAMLVRTASIRQIGMFDPRYFCYCEDVDWGVRARRAGWGIEVLPDARVEHIVGATSAGLVGTYYRARNLPLLLRVTFGRTRFVALVLSSPTELVYLASLLRRGHFALAMRGVIAGWIAGVAMRR